MKVEDLVIDGELSSSPFVVIYKEMQNNINIDWRINYNNSRKSTSFYGSLCIASRHKFKGNEERKRKADQNGKNIIKCGFSRIVMENLLTNNFTMYRCLLGLKIMMHEFASLLFQRRKYQTQIWWWYYLYVFIFHMLTLQIAFSSQFFKFILTTFYRKGLMSRQLQLRGDTWRRITYSLISCS